MPIEIEYEVLMQRDGDPAARRHSPPLGEGVKMMDLESVSQWARKRSAQLGSNYRLMVCVSGDGAAAAVFCNGRAAEEAAHNAR